MFIVLGLAISLCWFPVPFISRKILQLDFFYNEGNFIVHMCCVFIANSSVSRHLWGFHFLAIVNMDMQVTLELRYRLLCKCTQKDLGHMIAPIPIYSPKHSR